MSLSKIKKEAKILLLVILPVCFLLQMELRAAEQAGPDWSKGLVEYAMLEGHKQGIVSAVFSPDGKYLATGERKAGGAKATLWEVPSGKFVRTFEGHKYWVSKLAFSPDGRFLSTGSADEFTMWNTETGKKLQTITAHTKGLTCIAFSPDGTFLVTTSMDNTAKLWKIKE